MYWFSYDQSGFDIRYARLHILGFIFCASSDQDSNSRSVPASEDPIELLGKPLRVGRRYDVFEKIFANSLHALQVSTKLFDNSAVRFSALGSSPSLLTIFKGRIQ